MEPGTELEEGGDAAFGVTVPEVGGWIPAMSRSSVDFPEPLWPMNP